MKVYCKKDKVLSGKLIFKEGRYYDGNKLNENYISIENYVFICDDRGLVEKSDNPPMWWFSDWIFEDYFYTEKRI